jgi:1,4-dihydroxy-6-naphthoate synthase
MYVNEWTLDFGERGREAVRQLLRRGHEAGVIDRYVEPEFVETPEEFFANRNG